MKQKKEFKLSYLTTHFTTLVSVTLVLLMIGLIALVSVGASNETHRLQEQIEVSVVLTDSVTDESAQAIAGKIKSMPYAKSVELISAHQAIEEWNSEENTDLEEILGVNPFSPEIALTLNANYTSPDSISDISGRLSALPDVEEVVVPDASMVAEMNKHLGTLTMIFAGIAIVMLIISFVLINNTVRLSIYARRFSIHTMQLVGATDAFIRKPFLRDSVLNGIFAGVLAVALLGVLVYGAEAGGVSELSRIIDLPTIAMIGGGLIALGALICMSAAALATRKYLHSDYDDLFKQ